MANREIPNDSLIHLAGSHCAALLAGSMPNIMFEGSQHELHAWGTMTFVSVGAQVLGITCDHVVKEAEATGCPGFMLALGAHTPLKSPLVARSNPGDIDFPFDVAVFELNQELLLVAAAAGIVPLPLDETPVLLEEGEVALAVGFPRYCRAVVDEESIIHRRCYLSATCQSVSDRGIVLHEEVPDQPADFKIGGMSGGPIFRIDSPESYLLAGLVCQGRARADTTEGGGSGGDLWLFGFPVSRKLITSLLEVRSVVSKRSIS
jgi:hypothetical protein